VELFIFSLILPIPTDLVIVYNLLTEMKQHSKQKNDTLCVRLFVWCLMAFSAQIGYYRVIDVEMYHIGSGEHTHNKTMKQYNTPRKS